MSIVVAYKFLSALNQSTVFIVWLRDTLLLYAEDSEAECSFSPKFFEPFIKILYVHKNQYLQISF